MGLAELFLIAVGLSMDAFAVSLSTGIAVPGFGVRQAARIGLWCGFFQFSMPLAGWFLGSSVKSYIEFIDHWIAFGLLALIGASMIREALSGEGGEAVADLSVRRLFFLALATSIDALAVGVGFAFLNVNIAAAAGFIGAVTFTLSAAGVKAGAVFGARYKSRAEITGGVILILLGGKILLEHLGIIHF